MLFLSCKNSNNKVNTVKDERPLSEKVVGSWIDRVVSEKGLVTELTDSFSADGVFVRNLLIYDFVSDKQYKKGTERGTYSLGYIDQDLNINENNICLTILERDMDGRKEDTYNEYVIKILKITDKELICEDCENGKHHTYKRKD